MKKIFFAVVTAMVALFGLNSCEETYDKAVSVSFTSSGSFYQVSTSKDTTTYDAGATKWDLDAIYLAELQKIGEPLSDNAVLLNHQTSEKAAKAKVLEAAANADKRVYEVYGVGDAIKVHRGWSDLSVTVYYNWDADPVEAVTYTYKDVADK